MSNENAVERRLKQQKLRRKARRGEIAIRRLYKIIRFLIIMFLFYSAYRISLVHYWYLPADIFNKYPNEHIEILGNSIVKEEKILSQIRGTADLKKPIYMINPAKISKGLVSGKTCIYKKILDASQICNNVRGRNARNNNSSE